MKNLLKNALIFVALAAAFSSLGGCKGASTMDASESNSIAASNTATKTAAKDPSTYPMLASSIANADMEALDGTKSKLADRKGKVLLINLWAIWCGPCRAEMPYLVELQNKYRDQGFEVIGLNVGKDQDSDEGESVQAIKDFGEKLKVNYELVRINRATAALYYKVAQMEGIPISLVVDRDGRLRAVLRGGGAQAIADMDKSIALAIGETQ